jgi:hypothetical protein
MSRRREPGRAAPLVTECETQTSAVANHCEHIADYARLAVAPSGRVAACRSAAQNPAAGKDAYAELEKKFADRIDTDKESSRRYVDLGILAFTTKGR